MAHETNFRLPEPAVAKDPAGYYDELRSQCPVAHTEAHGGFWLMSRFKDVNNALLDIDVFSSAHCVTIPVLPKPPVPCLEQDEPEHRKYRRPIQAWFTTGRMAKLEDQVRQIVTECLDPIVDTGSADLATVLAEPIPPVVMALLFGLPEQDWPWFRERGSAFLRLAGEGDLAGSAEAIADIKNYLQDALDQRRSHPTGDMLSELLEITIDDEPIRADRALELAEMLLGAGHQTTVGGIGGLLYRVGSDPEVRDRLIESPSLIAKAVEEAVRLETPLPGLGRMVTTDVDVADIEIPEGERVMLLFGAANRDPDVFEAPEEFRIDRARNQHLGFGGGIHRCAGAPLARLEMRVVLEEVLSRMPAFRIDRDAVTVNYALGRDFGTLPATWTVRSERS